MSSVDGIPPRKPQIFSPPRLRLLKKLGKPPTKRPRQLKQIKSPHHFNHRCKQRKRPDPVDPEIALLMQQMSSSTAKSTFSNSTASVSSTLSSASAIPKGINTINATNSANDAMPWLEEEDFMAALPNPEKLIKPADRWFINCRDPKQWLPPLRAMSTLIYVPSADMKSETRTSKNKLNKKGYSYLMFGIGQKREHHVVELNMKTYTWTNIIGRNNFGTEWSPGPRAGHCANYLGKGRIFIYGGEQNPKVQRQHQKKIIGAPSSNREFVEGPLNMLAFDVSTSTWERFQPRISPGPRYLSSLTKLKKKTGNNLLLFGGASVIVQKKKKPGAKQRRHAATSIVDLSAAKDLHKERTGRGSDMISEPITTTEVPKETFASEWRLKNDIWCLDTNTMQWYEPKCNGIGPKPRMGHTATESAIGSLFIIGGIRGIPKKKKRIIQDDDDDDDDGSSPKRTRRPPKQPEPEPEIKIIPEDFFTIWELITTSSPMTWNRIQSRGMNPSKRVLHTAVLSPWDNQTIYIFGAFNIEKIENVVNCVTTIDCGNLEQDKNDLSNNLLTFDTMTSEWKVNEQIGKLPSARYGHSMVLTDTHAPGSKVNLVSFDKGKTLSSSMEYRKIKMWIVGGSSVKGFEPLHIYELSINPPPCLLEQHGRWKTKVEGHYAYQRQRLLQKPFAAWRDFIKTRRRKHVLAEHDSIIAQQLPNRSSLKYTKSFKNSLTGRGLKRSYKLNEIQSCGMHYQLFKNAMTGRRVQNRVVHLSMNAASIARELQNKEDELEERIEADGRKKAKIRERDGLTKDLHQSGSASVLESMMASVLLNTPGSFSSGGSALLSNGGGSSTWSSGDEFRPKSSPGKKRYGSGGNSNRRPGTAPSKGLRSIKKGVTTKLVHGEQPAKFISSNRRNTFFDASLSGNVRVKNSSSSVF